MLKYLTAEDMEKLAFYHFTLKELVIAFHLTNSSTNN